MIRPTRSIAPAFLAQDVFTHRPLGAALTDTVAAKPDGLALVEGDRRIPWRELDQRSHACARRLRSLGVGAHDVVTVILPSWWEAVVSMHALLKLGAVNNPVVPIYRDAELRFILGQARPRAVVTPHRFRRWDYVEMFARLTAEMDDPPTIVVVRPRGRCRGASSSTRRRPEGARPSRARVTPRRSACCSTRRARPPIPKEFCTATRRSNTPPAPSQSAATFARANRSSCLHR